MFVVEVAASWSSGSVLLLADSIDFFGDAANYALTLAVLAYMARVRSISALVKGAWMGLFGLRSSPRRVGRLGREHPRAGDDGSRRHRCPNRQRRGGLMLYGFRAGDANMRSVWVCSRNDAVGNAAVLLAATGVFGTSTAWPDLAMAALMAGLALSGAIGVIKRARAELRQPQRRAESLAPVVVQDCCAPAPVVQAVPMPVSRRRPSPQP